LERHADLSSKVILSSCQSHWCTNTMPRLLVQLDQYLSTATCEISLISDDFLRTSNRCNQFVSCEGIEFRQGCYVKLHLALACTTSASLPAKTERLSDNAVLYYDYTTTRVRAISLSIHNLLIVPIYHHLFISNIHCQQASYLHHKP
jgi:hypothetical protein